MVFTMLMVGTPPLLFLIGCHSSIRIYSKKEGILKEKHNASEIEQLRDKIEQTRR